MQKIDSLIHEISACRLCEEHLPLGVRPVLQISSVSKILITGQAPGRKVHESGVPFDDASGDRLRSWMGVSKAVFYNPKKIAILPMSFCYPGKGDNGDLPPRPECEKAWRKDLLEQLPDIELTLVLGKYAQSYHLDRTKKSVTEQVKSWKDYWPDRVPLPHPSPRNNIWLSKHPWFESELLPVLKKTVATILEL